MDVLNVISLHKREDRILSLANQMKITGVPVRLWEGVEGNLTPARNINTAHKKIVRWAKENNQERCFIGEDDIVFSNAKSWQFYLSQIPVSFDLFFAMIYAGEIEEGKIINGFSGLTCYCVHNRFYDEFLAIPDDLHLDRALGMKCHEREYFVCQPYICKQSGGYSDNMMKPMQYNEFEKNMTFFDGIGYD